MQTAEVVINFISSERTLILKFSSAEEALWQGGRNGEVVDEKGQNLLTTLSRRGDVESVSLLTVEQGPRTDNLIFIQPTDEADLETLSGDALGEVARICGHTLEKPSYGTNFLELAKTKRRDCANR